MIDHPVDKHGQVKLVRHQTRVEAPVEEKVEKGSQQANKRGTEAHKKSPKRCDRQTDRAKKKGLEKLSVSRRRLRAVVPRCAKGHI